MEAVLADPPIETVLVTVCRKFHARPDYLRLNGKHRFDVHVVKALRALREAATFCRDPHDYYLKAAVKFGCNSSNGSVC